MKLHLQNTIFMLHILFRTRLVAKSAPATKSANNGTTTTTASGFYAGKPALSGCTRR
jgi:hypothetical protein